MLDIFSLYGFIGIDDEYNYFTIEDEYKTKKEAVQKVKLEIKRLKQYTFDYTIRVVQIRLDCFTGEWLGSSHRKCVFKKRIYQNI